MLFAFLKLAIESNIADLTAFNPLMDVGKPASKIFPITNSYVAKRQTLEV